MVHARHIFIAGAILSLYAASCATAPAATRPMTVLKAVEKPQCTASKLVYWTVPCPTTLVFNREYQLSYSAPSNVEIGMHTTCPRIWKDGRGDYGFAFDNLDDPYHVQASQNYGALTCKLTVAYITGGRHHRQVVAEAEMVIVAQARTDHALPPPQAPYGAR